MSEMLKSPFSWLIAWWKGSIIHQRCLPRAETDLLETNKKKFTKKRVHLFILVYFDKNGYFSTKTISNGPMTIFLYPFWSRAFIIRALRSCCFCGRRAVLPNPNDLRLTEESHLYPDNTQSCFNQYLPRFPFASWKNHYFHLFHYFSYDRNHRNIVTELCHFVFVEKYPVHSLPVQEHTKILEIRAKFA